MENETAESKAAVHQSVGAKLSLNPIKSLFSDAWELYKERFPFLFRIVLLPALITILGYTVSDLRLPFSHPLGGVILFVGWLISLFNILPLIYSIQNKTDVDDSYKAALPWVLPFAWLTILEIIAVAGAFIMLIIPGVWLVFAFTLTSFVFVLEGRRGFDALRQSKDYINGYWWAVVGRILLMSIFLMLAAALVQSIAVPIAGNMGGTIAGMILTLFTTPFTAVYCYKIYQNLKALKPELVNAKPTEGVNFIRASAIVGLVLLIGVILGIIFLAWHGVAQSSEMHRWMHPQ